MSVGFRRICTSCLRAADWTPDGGEDGSFFHADDKTPLCADGHVDLEVKNFEQVGDTISESITIGVR